MLRKLESEVLMECAESGEVERLIHIRDGEVLKISCNDRQTKWVELTVSSSPAPLLLAEEVICNSFLPASKAAMALSSFSSIACALPNMAQSSTRELPSVEPSDSNEDCSARSRRRVASDREPPWLRIVSARDRASFDVKSAYLFLVAAYQPYSSSMTVGRRTKIISANSRQTIFPIKQPPVHFVAIQGHLLIQRRLPKPIPVQTLIENIIEVVFVICELPISHHLFPSETRIADLRKVPLPLCQLVQPLGFRPQTLPDLLKIPFCLTILFLRRTILSILLLGPLGRIGCSCILQSPLESSFDLRLTGSVAILYVSLREGEGRLQSRLVALVHPRESGCVWAVRR